MMTEAMICSSFKNIVIPSITKKPKVIIKPAKIVEIWELVEKQPPLTPNNEDNISTKSSAQQSQSYFFNTLEIITNNTTTTQLFNMDNDNTDESFEHRRPTISERFDNIHISLDQVNNQMKNYPMGQTTTDDVEVLKSKDW